jgi:hypothetical protein
MRNERNGHQTALLLFAVAVIVAMLMAFFTTFERVEKRTATSETAPGTTGLATALRSAMTVRIRLAGPSIRRGPADNRRKSALLAWYVAADRRRSEPHMTTTPSVVETNHRHARPRLRTVVSKTRN